MAPYTFCNFLAVRNSCPVCGWREGFSFYTAITILYQDASAVYSKTLQELPEDQMIKKDKCLKDNKTRGLKPIFSWTNNYFLL